MGPLAALGGLAYMRHLRSEVASLTAERDSARQAAATNLAAFDRARLEAAANVAALEHEREAFAGRLAISNTILKDLRHDAEKEPLDPVTRAYYRRLRKHRDGAN